MSPRNVPPVVAVVCLLLAAPVTAQPTVPKPGAPAKPAAKPGPPTQPKVSPERGRIASEAFAKGQRLFEEADYLGAIESFSKAYELRPHFLVLCNIALCHERQNDLLKSAEFYKRCLSEGADKTPQVDAVKNSLQKVENRITWLKVRSRGSGGAVYVDGRERGNTPARIAVNPGSHVVEVRREGAKTVTTTVTARGGEMDLELTPEVAQSRTPKKKRRRLHQAYFWSAAGLSVVFATVAIITGVQTLKIRDDYEENPSRELLDRGTDRRLVTNLMWAGAAVSAGSATALYFFSDLPWTREKKRAAPGAATVGIGIRGTF